MISPEDQATKDEMEREWLAALRDEFGDVRHSTIDVLRRNAALAPDDPVLLEYGRQTLSNSGLLQLATRTAADLNRLGLGPGSRAVLALPTTVESAAAYVCFMAALTILPIGASSPADEYERYLIHARADTIVVHEGANAAAVAAAARVGIPALELAYPTDGAAGIFRIVGAPDEPELEPRFAGPEDTAVVIPTSGTTSLPKLAPWSQRGLSLVSHFGRDVFQVIDALPYPTVGMLPLYLTGGCLPLIRSICWRSSYACVPGNSPALIYHYLAAYRPVSLLVAPALLQRLVDEAPQHQAELGRIAVRKITSVSSAMPEALLQAAERIFGAQIQVVYGMTEAQTITRVLFDPDTQQYPMGYVGQHERYLRLRICGDDGGEVPAGSIGEIAVLSPRAFNGYEHNPAANALAFPDGWFHTGDAGYLDSAGVLYLTGRVKELINRGGSKVSPVDVDDVLAQHPAVVEAATFAFPHAGLGEDIAAAIVLREPGASERELRAFAARRLASYKVPSRFVFVDALPRTDLGKVKRLELAERFRNELAR